MPHAETAMVMEVSRLPLFRLLIPQLLDRVRKQNGYEFEDGLEQIK